MQLVDRWIARMAQSENFGHRCARICAGMSGFLLVIGVQTDFAENALFSLVKSLFFETQGDVLKAMISES